MPKLQAKARMRMSKAIRYKCLDCVAGQEGEVRNCDILDCSLWEFRFGKNPTPEMAAAAKEVKVLGRDRELWNPKMRAAQVSGK